MTIKITQPLLDTLATATWLDSHVRVGTLDRWFHIDTTAGAWTLGPSGVGAYSIAEVDFGRMRGTAQDDGSWIDAAGAQWHMTAHGSGGPGSTVTSDVGPAPGGG